MTNLEDHAKAAGTNIINNTIMKLNPKKISIFSYIG